MVEIQNDDKTRKHLMGEGKRMRNIMCRCVCVCGEREGGREEASIETNLILSERWIANEHGSEVKRALAVSALMGCVILLKLDMEGERRWRWAETQYGSLTGSTAKLMSAREKGRALLGFMELPKQETI